jgi:hypothetical protein
VFPAASVNPSALPARIRTDRAAGSRIGLRGPPASPPSRGRRKAHVKHSVDRRGVRRGDRHHKVYARGQRPSAPVRSAISALTRGQVHARDTAPCATTAKSQVSVRVGRTSSGQGPGEPARPGLRRAPIRRNTSPSTSATAHPHRATHPIRVPGAQNTAKNSRTAYAAARRAPGCPVSPTWLAP